MEFALAGIIVLVLGYHAFEAHTWRIERTQLLNRITARTPGEYLMLERTPAKHDPTQDPLRGRDEAGRLDGAWSV